MLALNGIIAGVTAVVIGGAVAAGMLAMPVPVSAALPAPDPVEEIEDEEPPPVPATLKLWLLDAQKGVPIAATARIWRLGAPDGRSRLVYDARAPEDGLELADLVPGRYRVQCDVQAARVPDLAEFVVRPGANERTEEIELPVDHPVDLVVLGSDGRPLTEAFPAARDRWRAQNSVTRTPEWVGRGWIDEVARGPGFRSLWAGSGCGPRRPLRALGQVAAVPAFKIGPNKEPSKCNGTQRARTLAFSGRSSVRTPTRVTHPTRLVAISVQTERLATNIFHPDGTPARGGTVEAVCDAVEIGDGDPAEMVQSLEVRVSYLQPGGYQEAHFTWRADREPERIVLKP